VREPIMARRPAGVRGPMYDRVAPYLGGLGGILAAM